MAHKVLDLFAGSGWGVACQRLGVDEQGVEIMPAAIETRRINGMATPYHDVWDAHMAAVLEFDTLLASPPCQTFSLAGSGAGRRALDDVLRVVREKGYRNIDLLRDWAARLGDDRTGLVLTPLHYVHRFRPVYVAFEQVPTVLPVWEVCAEEMRDMGYSVWTGYLNSEQYGVPQTRKRAYLIARRDGGEARPPAPTHSLYHKRDPKRLDEGVLPWVSMADALGCRESRSLVSNYSSGTGAGYTPPGNKRPRGVYPDAVPSVTITSKATSMEWLLSESMRGTHLAQGTRDNSSVRPISDPAATMAFGNDFGSFRWVLREDHASTYDAVKASRQYMTLDEAKVIQSYPQDFQFAGNKQDRAKQIGNAVPPLVAEAVLKELWEEEQ